jgi:hypothetical protein
MMPLAQRVLAVLLSLSTLPVFAQAGSATDLRRIYLYTMTSFMHQITTEYQQQLASRSKVDADVDAIMKLHQKIGFSIDKPDYQGQDASLDSASLLLFTPLQRKDIQDKKLNDINTIPGQLFYYEVIFEENPLGGFALLPSLTDDAVRLRRATRSDQLANFMMQNNLWAEYLGRWGHLVQKRRRYFDTLMQASIASFNAELAGTT